MKKLVLRQSGDWIVVDTVDKIFIDCVKAGITPASYRKYDSENRTWLVWYEKAPDLARIASEFVQVDWGELPARWQMLIAGGRRAMKPVSGVYTAPHAVLHLLKSAPRSVIKAAYRALLAEYHPDNNDGKGDSVKLNEVIVAYRKIVGK